MNKLVVSLGKFPWPDAFARLFFQKVIVGLEGNDVSCYEFVNSDMRYKASWLGFLAYK